MKEAGIGNSSQKSEKLTHFSGMRFDYVVTMCDRAKLAITGSIPEGTNRIYRNFASLPEIRKNKAENLADFRTLRDEIDLWLTEIFPDCPDQRNGKKGENKQ